MKVHKTIKKIRKATERGALQTMKVGNFSSEKTHGFHFTIENADRKALSFVQSLFEGEADRQIRRVNDFGGLVYIEVDEVQEIIKVETKPGGAKAPWKEPIVFGQPKASVEADIQPFEAEIAQHESEVEDRDRSFRWQAPTE